MSSRLSKTSKGNFRRYGSFNVSLYRPLNYRPAPSFFSSFLAPYGLHFFVLARSIICASDGGLHRKFCTFECMSLRIDAASIRSDAQKFAIGYTKELLALIVQDSTQPLQNVLALQQLSWATSSFQCKPYSKQRHICSLLPQQPVFLMLSARKCSGL
jgi:hypothetical protein